MYSVTSHFCCLELARIGSLETISLPLSLAHSLCASFLPSLSFLLIVSNNPFVGKLSNTVSFVSFKVSSDFLFVILNHHSFVCLLYSSAFSFCCCLWFLSAWFCLLCMTYSSLSVLSQKCLFSPLCRGDTAVALNICVVSVALQGWVYFISPYMFLHENVMLRGFHFTIHNKTQTNSLKWPQNTYRYTRYMELINITHNPLSWILLFMPPRVRLNHQNMRSVVQNGHIELLIGH